jgi:hypothetical protein
MAEPTDSTKSTDPKKKIQFAKKPEEHELTPRTTSRITGMIDIPISPIGKVRVPKIELPELKVVLSSDTIPRIAGTDAIKIPKPSEIAAAKPKEKEKKVAIKE